MIQLACLVNVHDTYHHHPICNWGHAHRSQHSLPSETKNSQRSRMRDRVRWSLTVFNSIHQTSLSEQAIVLHSESSQVSIIFCFEKLFKCINKIIHGWLSSSGLYTDFSELCIDNYWWFKVGVNPSLKREMWLLMDLITKKPCPKMYKGIHFWNQKNQMNPMVATDFCKIMRFSRNSSVTMVTIEFFLDSITKIWFY